MAVCIRVASARLPAEAVSQLGAVSEGEDWSEDGPDDGQHVGRHMDVGLEHRHPRVIHRVKQRGQPVPHREDGEGVPENSALVSPNTGMSYSLKHKYFDTVKN